MAVKVYPSWVNDYGHPDWANGSNVYYVILIETGSYGTSHTTITSASLDQIDSVGYAAQALTGRTSILSGATVIADGSDVPFGTLSVNLDTIISAVIVRQLGGSPASTDRLCAWYDGGVAPNDLPYTVTGGTFEIVWPAGGIIVSST
jgi:hypothetical protein